MNASSHAVPVQHQGAAKFSSLQNFGSDLTAMLVIQLLCIVLLLFGELLTPSLNSLFDH
jgi:hypothetical protein